MPRYVVYLRRPLPRNGVDDPAPVEWTPDKERRLWEILKDSSADVDWPRLARQFQVSEVYILQQAAWLYEKELDQLRQKMVRITPHARRLSSASQVASQMARTSFFDSKALLTASNSPRMDTEPFTSQYKAHAPAPSATPQRVAMSNRAGSTSPSHSVRSISNSSGIASPRRLMSMSRVYASDEGDLSQSGSSEGAFLPPRTASSRAGMSQSDLGTSSDNSLTRSALEDALMSRPFRPDSPGGSTGLNSPSMAGSR